jgi:hypothetical protein
LSCSLNLGVTLSTIVMATQRSQAVASSAGERPRHQHAPSFLPSHCASQPQGQFYLCSSELPKVLRWLPSTCAIRCAPRGVRGAVLRQPVTGREGGGLGLCCPTLSPQVGAALPWEQPSFHRQHKVSLLDGGPIAEVNVSSDFPST